MFIRERPMCERLHLAGSRGSQPGFVPLDSKPHRPIDSSLEGNS